MKSSPEKILTDYDQTQDHNSLKNLEQRRFRRWAKALLDLNRENRRLTVENRQLEYEATHDADTGLLNRKGLAKFLEKDPVINGVVLYIDGTNVKAVNDKLGHDVGDTAIVGIANVLNKSLADILVEGLRDDDQIARIGGDEFMAIIAPTRRGDQFIPPKEQLTIIKDRIAQGADQLREANPDFARVGFNIAVGGVLAEPGATIDDLKRTAEIDMMEHKDVQHLQSEIGAYREQAKPFYDQ